MLSTAYSWFDCFWINICLLKCWKHRWLIFFFSFPKLLVVCLCSIIYCTDVPVVELLFWLLRSCQLCYFLQKWEISHRVKLCQSVCGRLWCYSVCNSGYSHDNRKQRWKTPALFLVLRFTIINSRHVTHLDEQSRQSLFPKTSIGSGQDYTGFHLLPVLRKMVNYKNIIISPRFPHSSSHNTGYALVCFTIRWFSV